MQLTIASSIHKNFSLFSLQTLPHVVLIQDIIVDTQEELFYTFPTKKELLIKQQYADKVVTHDPGVKAFMLFFGKEEGMGRTQEIFFDQ